MGLGWVPWDSHGNGNKISHGNGMGMGTKCMGMGIKTCEWRKNSYRNPVLKLKLAAMAAESGMTWRCT